MFSLQLAYRLFKFYQKVKDQETSVIAAVSPALCLVAVARENEVHSLDAFVDLFTLLVIPLTRVEREREQVAHVTVESVRSERDQMPSLLLFVSLSVYSVLYLTMRSFFFAVTRRTHQESLCILQYLVKEYVTRVTFVNALFKCRHDNCFSLALKQMTL